MNEEEERARYIRYFQHALQREGTAAFIEGQARWFNENRSKLAAQFAKLAQDGDPLGAALSQKVLEHKDETGLNPFLSGQIFEPILQDVLVILEESGMRPRNPVVFASSPSTEPTAAGLPSTSEHVLFAGAGAFAFCNYWANIFGSALFKLGEIWEKTGKKPDIPETLLEDPLLHEAARLTFQFVLKESLLGFGPLDIDPRASPGRVLLVTAMEVFIVAHEIGHFIAHENYPDTNGLRPGTTKMDLELECDAVGLGVSAAYGVKHDNAFAFQFIGPMFFFSALHTSERAEAILRGGRAPASDTHPSNLNRLQNVFRFAEAARVAKNEMESMRDAFKVALAIQAYVEVLAEQICADTRGGDK